MLVSYFVLNLLNSLIETHQTFQIHYIPCIWIWNYCNFILILFSICLSRAKNTQKCLCWSSVRWVCLAPSWRSSSRRPITKRCPALWKTETNSEWKREFAIVWSKGSQNQSKKLLNLETIFSLINFEYIKNWINNFQRIFKVKILSNKSLEIKYVQYVEKCIFFLELYSEISILWSSWSSAKGL